MNTFEQLQKEFFSHSREIFNLSNDDLSSCSFELNVEEHKQQFGDISSNICMVLAKPLGKAPRDLASTIVQTFSHPLIEKIDPAGPGFLNIFLKQEAFNQIAIELFEQKESFFKTILGSNKKHFSLEFVSANPTGPLHLGHGRGGIIGDVLGNILSFLGHKTTKEYYINDAGVQMQRLGTSFKIRCMQVLGDQIDVPEDGYQGKYLVEFAQECVSEYGESLREKNDTFFSHYAEERLLAMIKTTLKEYGIEYDVWFSERTLHEQEAIARGIQTLSKGGYTYEQDNALWFTSTKFGDDKDRVLRKKDGTLTYAAADIAYMLDKIERGAQKLLYVLGQDHHSYVVRLKGIIQALGYKPDMLDVILYQLVTLKETEQVKRMSKRTGSYVTLSEIISTVGKDVARFFYLNRKADAHLEFDLTLALKKTDENPVYYLQYAYVRTKSIAAKASEHSELTTIKIDDAQHLGKEEQLLLKKIVALKALLTGISKHYQTHLLTYYLLELAQLFHSYYSKYKVINPDDFTTSRSRLLLVKLLNETLGMSLKLIGISLPESM